ncbi:3'-5' exonuclease [Nocardia salmonicida]|uniref:3'-5' exonuclease n=1 Tax=Nocardia salmonicida TaxID=53431 RepID=UPI0033EAF653
MGLPVPVGRQSDAVYMKPQGHLVVLGTAGTGKTVMAILRAQYLAHPSTANSGRTALLTFNRSLAAYLRHLGGSQEHVVIENYHTFAKGYLSSLGLMGSACIARPELREELIQRSVVEVAVGYRPHKFFEQPTEFFSDELAWIDGHGLDSLAQYLATPRTGRMDPLQPPQRKALWAIRTAYRRRLAAANKRYDWPSVAPAVNQALREDDRPRRYRHIVVDEAQDLSPEAIRSLAAAIPPEGSLTLFADYAQQVSGQRTSWKTCGLTVQKIERFVDNYRNSPEIARLAIAMADMPHFRDSTDLVEPKAPQRAAGTKPTLVQCRSEEDEISTIVAAALAASGGSARVGVLARTRAEARKAIRGIPGARTFHGDMNQWSMAAGVWAGTYHSAKGLEFDTVLLPFCGSTRMPDPGVVDAFGADEARSRESRLLYVGVTRARSEVVITYTGQLTPLLPPPSSNLYQVVS